MPLDWVRSREGNLPIAAAVVERQWRKPRAQRLRIRSLVERALDVVEEELEQLPSPELAVAILRTLRVEPPEAMPRSAEMMLCCEMSTDKKPKASCRSSRRERAWALPGGTLARWSKRPWLSSIRRPPQRLSAPEDPPTGSARNACGIRT
jgi:hypothetical protein